MLGQDVDGEHEVEMKCPRMALRRSMLTSTSGGSSETEENEFTVIPCGCPWLVERR